MNVEVRAVACEVTLMPQMVFNQDVLYFSLKTYTDVRNKPGIIAAEILLFRRRLDSLRLILVQNLKTSVLQGFR